ncbi:MAG TPA: MFS transporter [Actinomycetes bacterium]|nr:MFS transporter [Actinomycetes bacterium]
MPQQPEANDRLFTRPFLMLAIAELGYFLAEGAAIYALPLYVTGPVGSNQAGAGVAFGTFAIAALLVRPIAGRLADTRGRFPLLVFGASTTALALVLTAQVESLAAVILLRCLFGLGEAAFVVAGFAALADLAPPSRLGEALSYNSLSLYTGLAVGPLVADLLADRWGLDVAWYAAAILAAGAVAATFGVGETLRGDVHSGARRLIHWPAVPAGLGFLASIIAISAFVAFAALRAGDVELGNAGLPLFMYGATVVVCRIAFAKVPDRLPSLPLGAASLTAMACGLTVAAGWHTQIGLLCGAIIFGVGVAFSTPAFFSAMFATAAPDQRGAASATASILLDIGLGFGPLALGLVAESLGLSWTFGVGAGIALVGTLWVLRLARSQGRAPVT